MATTQISAEIKAPPQVIYSVISDPLRLHEWDTSYEAATPLGGDRDGGPAFKVDRTLANRGMHFACRVVRADPPSDFAFVCDGGAGEIVREHFSLSAADAGTRFTREMEFELGAQDPLGEVPALTFTQAWMDRSVEQAFAHLEALLASAPPTPQSWGETTGSRTPPGDARSADTFPPGLGG